MYGNKLVLEAVRLRGEKREGEKEREREIVALLWYSSRSFLIPSGAYRRRKHISFFFVFFGTALSLSLQMYYTICTVVSTVFTNR